MTQGRDSDSYQACLLWIQGKVGRPLQITEVAEFGDLYRASVKQTIEVMQRLAREAN